MAKDHITDYDTTAGNNTDVDGVNIAEGTAPSNINDAIRELMSHLAEWYTDIGGGTSSGGSAGAYTLTTQDAVAAYAQDQFYMFEANHAMPDTATATLNINAIGAKPLRKGVSFNLKQGDIRANQMCMVAYEQTTDVFHLLNPTPVVNEFHVYRTANQTAVVTGTRTKITWGAGDVTVAITNSDLDQTNDRFTPTVAGTYVFSCGATLDDLADQTFFSAYLLKNSTNGSDGTQLAFQNLRASGTTDPTLALTSPPIAMNGSSDYVEVWVEHGHGSNRNVLGSTAGQTWFSGYRLR